MKRWSLVDPIFPGIAESAMRLINFRAPNALVYLYLIGLCFIFSLVSAHIPIAAFPDAPHDDGLYITLGRSLAQGQWLGSFSQFTLMKGPGYSAFLALNNWLGFPISLSQALFHCFAIALFVVACHRFIKSHLMSAILFALLLWHPIFLSGDWLRVLRDKIYLGQTFIVLGLMLLVVLGPAQSRHRRLYAALAGAFLGWFWLTREEGVWIIPALGFMILVAVLRIFRNRWRDVLEEPISALNDPRLQGLAMALSIVFGVFVLTQITFSSVNWLYYDKFVGVDFKEKNFQRAMGAIDSVRSGGIKPFVAITRAARKQVNTVSPAFASLTPYFDGIGKGWEQHGCAAIPSTCGEIASGWFMWALRDAASATGHYASPTAASEFFGRLADEILTACASKKLDCQRQLIADMPPISWSEVIRRMLPRYGDAFDLLMVGDLPLALKPSSGAENLFAPTMRFLNYPLHTRPIGIPDLDIYSLSGWYYKSKNSWISEEVRTPDGTVAASRFERRDSSDVQQSVKDPDASNQRFLLLTRCSADCVLIVRTPEGAMAQKRLADLQKAPIDLELGGGHVRIDYVDFQPDPEYTLSPIDRLCGQMRNAVLKFYKWVLWPVLAVGVIAFLASVMLFWRRSIWNTCFVMALVCWGLTLERTTLLLLIDSSSFPALNSVYLGPAYLMLVSAAVLSIAAWLQLVRPSHRTLPDAPVRHRAG